MLTDLRSLLTFSAIETPFPVGMDGEVVRPGRGGLPAICSSCAKRSCLKSAGLGEASCEFGVRYHSLGIQGSKVVAFGLAPLGGSSGRHPSLKGRGFPRESVAAWASEVDRLFQAIGESQVGARNDAFESIHDLSRLAAEVSNLANELVRPYLANGLGAAPPVHLSILKASELLVKEFDRMELLLNPRAASIGWVYTHIYQLAHKYAQIIDLAYCKGRNKRVVMTGKSHNSLRMYESISVLVFALIENAAKYCMSGERVEVEVSDSIGLVDLKVSSVGPLIEQDELGRIFERGFRGRWARQIQDVAGQGLGLYLANIVAEAHQTRIEVESKSQSYERDGIPVALNIFRVKLRAL